MSVRKGDAVTTLGNGSETTSSSETLAAPVRGLETLAGGIIYRLSVAQYDQLAKSGVLGKEDKVELIEGLIIKKMTRNERHITTTWLVLRAINQVLPEDYFTAKEDPIVLARSELEPDVSILRGSIRDFSARKPAASDVALVVEVSDSSRQRDRRKLALYAEAAIPYCWIVSLAEPRIEVYSRPTGPDLEPQYRLRTDHAMGEFIPLSVDGRELSRLKVDDLISQ